VAKGSGVLKLRSSFDRRLARLEHQRIWEHTPAAIDLAVEIVQRAVAMSNEDGATRMERIRALDLAHRVNKEIFVDRTIPVLNRIEATAAVMALPMADVERDAAEVEAGSVEAMRVETHRMMRELLARAIGNGSAALESSRPGLILLPRNGDAGDGAH